MAKYRKGQIWGNRLITMTHSLLRKVAKRPLCVKVISNFREKSKEIFYIGTYDPMQTDFIEMFGFYLVGHVSWFVLVVKHLQSVIVEV